jgi:hypothetical protein
VSFENKKNIPASNGEKQTRQNSKIYADILELCLIIIMSHINGKGLESTNQFYIFYYELDKLITHLDQQMFLMNHINAIILPKSLKLYFQTI